jgi:lipopolysaccharide export system protein LptA
MQLIGVARAGLLVAALAQAALADTSVPLGGLRADPTAPVEIEADSLAVSQTDGTATFQGNVLIAQGDMRLSAGSVTVTYAAATDGKQGRIERLTASGGVTLASGTEAAEAKEAIYEVPASRITMTGDVLLTQGQSVISGQTLVVDLKSGTGTMEGRVRTVLQPGGN